MPNLTEDQAFEMYEAADILGGEYILLSCYASHKSECPEPLRQDVWEKGVRLEEVVQWFENWSSEVRKNYEAYKAAIHAAGDQK